MALAAADRLGSPWCAPSSTWRRRGTPGRCVARHRHRREDHRHHPHVTEMPWWPRGWRPVDAGNTEVPLVAAIDDPAHRGVRGRGVVVPAGTNADGPLRPAAGRGVAQLRAGPPGRAPRPGRLRGGQGQRVWRRLRSAGGRWPWPTADDPVVVMAHARRPATGWRPSASGPVPAPAAHCRRWPTTPCETPEGRGRWSAVADLRSRPAPRPQAQRPGRSRAPPGPAGADAGGPGRSPCANHACAAAPRRSWWARGAACAGTTTPRPPRPMPPSPP